jgi:hypothetical protein
MTEKENKILDKYCKINFGYELWKYPDKTEKIKNYAYNTFSFKVYCLKYYLKQIFNQFIESFKPKR